MNIRDIADENLILIIGSPRSGTTWLAKIFDSHPDTLYRHEPDKSVREPLMQRNFEADEHQSYLHEARVYMRTLIATNCLKSIRIFPIFRKSYFPPGMIYVRALMLLTLAAIAWASGGRRAANIRVPDIVDPKRVGSVKLVMKSIVSHRRIGLIAKAFPKCRIIFIIRDPLAQVASMQRGIRLGKFEKTVPLDECLTTEYAGRYRFTPESFEALPLVDKLAWHWALHNEKALADLAGNERTMIVRYADLCREPIAMSKALLAFTGLSWGQQVEDFVRVSTTTGGDGRYYQIHKNSLADGTQRWATELSADEQTRILQIAEAAGLAVFTQSRLTETRESQSCLPAQALATVA
jgi:hypothetical protein